MMSRHRLSRLGRAALVALLVLLVVAGAVVVAIRAVGSYLVVADPLQPSDAIVVLDGATPAREVEAARLYQRGLAAMVILARGRDPFEAARQLAGGPTLQEQAASTLDRLGVPRPAIVKLDRTVENTHEELEVDFRYALARGLRRVILVTSPVHTRRVRTIWNVRYEATIPALVHPTPYDPFDGAGWWRSRRSLEEGLHELVGILHFWMGNPLPTFDRAR